MSLSPKVDLKVDWCSYKAAKYAVENWHYSRTMPAMKLVKIGIWESGAFIGAVIFGIGCNRNIGSPYGLKQTEICELVRVATKSHASHISQILRQCIRLLSNQSSGLRLIVSYADTAQGHHGGIYQAQNWIYTGPSKQEMRIQIGDKEFHKRSVSQLYGTTKMDILAQATGEPVKWVKEQLKHKYLYPLDKAMRRQIEKLRQPYPKRTPTGGASEPTEAGGSMPTRPLQIAGQNVRVI